MGAVASFKSPRPSPDLKFWECASIINFYLFFINFFAFAG